MVPAGSELLATINGAGVFVGGPRLVFVGVVLVAVLEVLALRPLHPASANTSRIIAIKISKKERG
jgi:hypothetical protein